MGEAHGWRSLEALETALLLKRLELPNESPWSVGKQPRRSWSSRRDGGARSRA